MHSLPKPEYIDTTADLEDLVEHLLKQSTVAIDTEANSLYAYQEQVCLVQISINPKESDDLDDVKDYIIDPLAIDDMSSLGAVTADPDIEIILHGAEYDVMSMKRDFDYEFAGIFDTHHAARTLGIKKVGLNNLLHQFFGVEVDKKYQQSNWGKRPLSKDMIRYAQMDTHYLLNLRNILSDELNQNGYLEEAWDTFMQLAQLPPLEKIFHEDGFWKIKDAKSLNDVQLAILKELYIWREKTAEALDRPPFKVMHNNALVQLAKRMPTGTNQLKRIRGFPKRQINRYAPKIFSAISRGRDSDPPEPKRYDPPPTQVLNRYDKLREWRKLKGQERGVESDIIVSKGVLWSLAYTMPTTHEDLEEIAELGDYRRHKYGDEILELIADIAEDETEKENQ